MQNRSYLPTTWYDPRLSLRPSPTHGQGLFASQLIREGEVVMIWGGTLYTRQDLEAIRAGKMKVAEFSYSFIEENSLIAAPPDGLDYYVNHACDPNVWMRDDVTVVARRDIAVDEEIRGDYAIWEAESNYVLEPCSCGTALCRQRITGNDWMRADLQERYRGHFLPYITRRIEHLK